jgi:acylphosphatase
MPVLHLRVQGKVQGVGFRWFVCDRANELGVAGWVRNTPDGDVELAARGSSERLQDLESAVGRGPSGARVESVHRIPTPDDASYPDPFRIRK